MRAAATRETLAESCQTGSISVPSTASNGNGDVVQILSEDRERRAAVLVNIGTVPVWISPIAQRNASTGFQLGVGAGLSVTHRRTMYAFCAPGSATDGLLSLYAESGEPA
jgi:hypothetical protein